MVSDCCPETTDSKSGLLIEKIETRDKYKTIPSKPRDCSEIPAGRSDGVYKIYPETSTGFDVYCNDGWTVIQNRQSGNVDFDRTWVDYKTGFGDVSENHWLGNEKIHILTSTKNYRLRIELTDVALTKKYAVYRSFHVGDETSKYTLSLCGYSGTAGDAMTQFNGMKFTTKDRDNDKMSYNCAVSLRAGGWFSACSLCNLNSLHRPGIDEHFSMHWRPWHHGLGLSTSLMMVR